MPLVLNGDVTKHILRGTVVTALIFAAAVTLPVFGLFGVLLVPLPVVYYRLKLGRRPGMIVPAAAFFLWLVLLGGMTSDLFIFMEQLVLGFALGEFLERRLSLEKTIGYTAGVVLLTGGCGVLLYATAAGVGMVEMLTDYVAKNLAVYQNMYEQLDTPDETLETLSNAIEHVQYVMVRILPGLFAAGALFGTWVCLLFARPLLKAGNLAGVTFGPLNRWKSPEPLVWGVIGFGGLMLVGDAGVRLVGANGLIVLLQVYFFQGIAIVSFYFDKKQMPGVLRWFIYSLIVLQIYVLVFVIGLGFFDMWLDFRKIKQPTETNGVS